MEWHEEDHKVSHVLSHLSDQLLEIVWGRAALYYTKEEKAGQQDKKCVAVL